jgi:peptidoglycan/xylan/chitin deacetylase (PgdA/CDA1 family)
VAVAAVLALAPSILSNPVQAEAPSPYPDGAIVSLTFDDGLATTYHEAAPILERHGLVGTIYVTTDFVGGSGRATWDELRDLQDRLGWEIGGHTLTHPHLSTLRDDAVRRELVDSKEDLEDRGLRVDTFASPYGDYDYRVLAQILGSYSAHRGFRERETYNRWPYEPHRLRVQSVETITPVESVLEWIDDAVARGEWLVLVFHEVFAEPCAKYRFCTTSADLERIVDHLAEREVRVATVRDVIVDDDAEWLMNETFADELSAVGWSAREDGSVRRHDGGRGAHPDAQWSIELNPSNGLPAQLVGPPVPVRAGATYRIDAHVDRRELVAGDISLHVEEFGATGKPLDTRVVGWVGAPVVQCRWSYSPATPEVATIRLSWVARGQEGESAYVDNMRVLEVAKPLEFTGTR